MTRKKLIIGIMVLIAALLVIKEFWYLPYFFMVGGIDSFFSEPETEFQMVREEIVDINTVVNITPEELSTCPALESALNSDACVLTVTSPDNEILYVCKVTHDDWKEIENFIERKIKKTNPTAGCFKFGEMYGDTCLLFGFARP